MISLSTLRSRRARRGGAGALELALSMPVLVGFMLAISDLGRFVTETGRATSAAAAVADLTAQTETFVDKVNPAQITNNKELAIVIVAGSEVAKPLDLYTDGAVIITVLSNPSGNAVVENWRRRWGRTEVQSGVGVTSMKGITLAKGEAAVYAEVGYKFHPYLLSGTLLGLDEDSNFMTVAIRRPRLSGPTLTAS